MAARNAGDNYLAGRISVRKTLRPLVYVIPVLVLGLFVFFEVTDTPVPFLSPQQHLDEHIHEGEVFLTGPGADRLVGSKIPYFELELADGSVLTRADLLESGKPTFLYFWATT